MFKYELIKALAKHFKLELPHGGFNDHMYSIETGNCFGYFKKEKLIIFSPNNSFGIKISIYEESAKFQVFYETFTKFYITKIFEYENLSETKEINNIYDAIANYKSEGIVPAKIDKIIKEIERLFALFDQYSDPYEFADGDIDLERFSKGEYVPKFSIEDVAYIFTEENKFFNIGMDFVSKEKMIMEISYDNFTPMYLKRTSGGYDPYEYHQGLIKDLLNYLEAHGAVLTRLNTVYSTIIIVDRTAMTSLYVDEKYQWNKHPDWTSLKQWNEDLNNYFGE